jgi:hypothetical protein
MAESSTQEPLAKDVCQRVHLDKPARALLRDEQTAIEYVQLLTREGHFNAAVNVLAQMFTPREAVWWACVCARQSPPDPAAPEWNKALAAAERWVTEMNEESRRAAGEAAKEAELANAAGCAAMAAFYSGGSIAPPDAPVAEPAPEVCPQLAAGSILASALTPNPLEAPARYRRFIEQGLGLYRDRGAA